MRSKLTTQLRSTNGQFAARATAALFGALAGIGGFVHGVGEVLQGNVRPSGVVVNSWTFGPIAELMGGEPGMTLVPNLFATGVLCMAVSATLAVWSVAFAHRRRGGWAQLGLALAMLLVGGGFGPPLIGLLAAVAGVRAGRRARQAERSTPTWVRRIFAVAWPGLYAAGAASGTFLVLGSLVLVYWVGLDAPDLFVGVFFFTVAALILILLAGPAFDAARGNAGALPGER